MFGISSVVVSLEFTPLEFETARRTIGIILKKKLEFTPLEFETSTARSMMFWITSKLEFTPLEFET